MGMATKSVSTLAIFFILFLVIFEVPETKAEDRKCLKEYGGNVGYSYCAPRRSPTFCYMNCVMNKGAKSGICRWGDAGPRDVKCLCDYCGDNSGSERKMGMSSSKRVKTILSNSPEFN
ncbi:hypothetical protein AALP_AA6G232900 [Arabis alpina]|uniref:Knottins-like domain-containing protein n=1 Tax=Arabis alpina TaxID=50452 RepID=A0A087GR70_ARAAL|nr:hypothetical protein AALP_AA6G232900 [Arabis alpina]